ncbi:MAG: caa(3)-type oxidase subunit IV [Alphaproteobacteria bacterium]|nr:caa(3)-type oxidase subunit IV [Alphaproteobacteria bacterium]
MAREAVRLAAAWGALMVLLGSTLGLSYVQLGSMNIAVALTIATAKALIVVFLFMKLARAVPLTWVFAAAGLFWLLIMFGLAATDYGARLWVIAS